MKTKITVIAILAMALVMMIGCNLVSEVQSIQLVNAPDAVYKVGATENVDASKFTVKITLNNGTDMELALTDSRLTVEGLVNGRLDVATPGVKTIKISYMGVSITATYIVEGTSVSATKWEADANATGNGAALLYALSDADKDGKVELSGEYNLAGKQWPAITLKSDLEIVGNNAVINGLTMTNAAVFSAATYNKDGKLTSEFCNAGLFAVVEGTAKDKAELTISGVKFTNIVIEQTNQKQGEFCKNFATVVGKVVNGIVSINNVTVENTTIKGNGRIAGLVGNLQSGELTINECNVEATLIGHNPVVVTGEEGEADKIGGLVGQVQGGKIVITNNDVKATVAGTRDCGGLIGYVAGSTDVTITGNEVLAGSSVTLSVEGGMNASKGKRHAGGIIGTWALSTVEPIFVCNTNIVEATIAINERYAELSSMGEIIGGYRYTEVEGVQYPTL